MTRMSKTNKRSVKKSTPILDKVAQAITEKLVKDDLNDLSYRELQIAAKAKGLKASGSTVDLIERLST